MKKQDFCPLLSLLRIFWSILYMPKSTNRIYTSHMTGFLYLKFFVKSRIRKLHMLPNNDWLLCSLIPNINVNRHISILYIRIVVVVNSVNQDYPQNPAIVICLQCFTTALFFVSVCLFWAHGYTSQTLCFTILSYTHTIQVYLSLELSCKVFTACRLLIPGIGSTVKTK